MASKGNIAARVTEVIAPVVKELGYDIWDVEYVKEGADWHLRVTIDSPDGIDINDCEKVHRAIDPILDECDPIETFYYLEVSSPGVERELRTDEHIARCKGMKVEAKLFAAHDGAKSIIGILGECADGKVVIERDGECVELEKNEISKLTTVYFED